MWLVRIPVKTIVLYVWENEWMGQIILNNLYLPLTVFILTVLAWGPVSHSIHCHCLKYWEGSLHSVTGNCRGSEIDFMRLISTDEVETHWECSPGRGCGRERAGREISTLRLPLCCRSARFFYSVSPAESGTCSAPWLDSAREKKHQQERAWRFGWLNTKYQINEQNLWWTSGNRSRHPGLHRHGMKIHNSCFEFKCKMFLTDNYDSNEADTLFCFASDPLRGLTNSVIEIWLSFLLLYLYTGWPSFVR